MFSVLGINYTCVLADDDFDFKVQQMVERTGYPREEILKEIDRYAEQETISKDVATNVLYDAVIASTSYEEQNMNISLYSSSSSDDKKLLDSVKGDIFYSPSGTGHVGLYSEDDQIIEAPGVGRVVTEQKAYKKEVEPKTRIAGVSSTRNGTTRLSYSSRSAVVKWARTKDGKNYAYTLDNKKCGNHDYNCSQLVWCSFKQTTGLNVDNSTDLFVTPSDIYHSNYVFYLKMV